MCWTSNTRSRRCLERKERNLGRREKTTIIEEEKEITSITRVVRLSPTQSATSELC